VQILNTLNRRLRDDERGFTLVELLVVIILIGILSAIGYALLLGERAKAQDGDAKSNVSNLALEVEACFAESERIRLECDRGQPLTDSGLPVAVTVPAEGCDPALGPAPPPGEVAVVASENTCYVIKGTSQAEDGGSNHVFIYRRDLGGTATRTCEPAGFSGCPDDGSW